MENLVFTQLTVSEIRQLFRQELETYFANNKQSNSTQPEAPDLLTIKQASELLNLSAPTLYTKVHHREIPVMKKGGKLYFSRSQLMSWLQEGQKATRQEIRAQAKNSIQKQTNK